MKKQVKLLNETIMYSVHPDTGKVVTHRLPWESGSPNLELYVHKGFTYERPPERSAEVPVREIIEARKNPDNRPVPKSRMPCPGCGKLYKRQGLKSHMKYCEKVKTS